MYSWQRTDVWGSLGRCCRFINSMFPDCSTFPSQLSLWKLNVPITIREHFNILLFISWVLLKPFEVTLSSTPHERLNAKKVTASGHFHRTFNKLYSSERGCKWPDRDPAWLFFASLAPTCMETICFALWCREEVAGEKNVMQLNCSLLPRGFIQICKTWSHSSGYYI